jgi:hypothetical protein
MLHLDIEKRNSSISGNGLFAIRPFMQGTIIWRLEPGDRLITYKELFKLPREQRQLPIRYRDNMFIATDGTEYLNHSCDANTWWTNDALVASRDILEGDEISLDYGTVDAHLWWKPKWECSCKTKNCRRFITGRDCLDASFQEKYQDHLPSWTIKFILQQSGLYGYLTGYLAWFTGCIRTLKAILIKR